MDLGECMKVHDLALRADYEIASKEQEYFFELDVSNTQTLALHHVQLLRKYFSFIPMWPLNDTKSCYHKQSQHLASGKCTHKNGACPKINMGCWRSMMYCFDSHECQV